MTRMRSEGNSACEEPPSCQLKKRIVNLLLLVATTALYDAQNILHKRVLSFKLNRSVEVWPNSLTKPSVRLVTNDMDEI